MLYKILSLILYQENKLFIRRPEFRSLVELRLPELSQSMLTVISKEYKIKKMNRRTLQFKVKGLHLKNRLLPLSRDTYELFSLRSQKHFRLIAKAKAYHFLGKGGWDGNNQGNT